MTLYVRGVWLVVGGFGGGAIGWMSYLVPPGTLLWPWPTLLPYLVNSLFGNISNGFVPVSNPNEKKKKSSYIDIYIICKILEM